MRSIIQRKTKAAQRSSELQSESNKTSLVPGQEGLNRLREWCITESRSICDDTSELSDFMEKYAINDPASCFIYLSIITTQIRIANDKSLPFDQTNKLPIAEILPLILYHQSSLLDKLGVDGTAIYTDRTMMTYDYVIAIVNNIPIRGMSDFLGPWWANYYNLKFPDFYLSD